MSGIETRGPGDEQYIISGLAWGPRPGSTLEHGVSRPEALSPASSFQPGTSLS